MKDYSIDINCDLGEGIGNDALLMPLLSSCNIACGGHAGDEKSMKETIEQALKHGVKIGVHPSYPDRENFGRKEIDITLSKLQENIENQINVFKKVLNKTRGELHHIKPHGALYNVAAKNRKIAEVILNAALNTVGNIFLYVPYNSVIHQLALERGIKVKVEAFADRNYNTDLSLVSRANTNAVITAPELVRQHLTNMIIHKKVVSIDGVEVPMYADTFCVHGDNSNAIEILKFLHTELPKNGIRIE